MKHEATQNGDFGSITWPKLKLGDLLEKVVRPVAVEKSGTYHQIGIRSHCKGIFHKSEVTGKQLGNKRVFWVEPGCLVLNIVFAWEQAVAMTTAAEKGMIASHRFPMYCTQNGKLLPEYAYIHFSSPRGKYDLGIASPGGAGRNKTLGGEEFKRLKIPVPPIKHQKLIIDIHNTWKRAIEQTEQLIAAKQKLKKGLMQQLLTGKRRFPDFGKPAINGKSGKKTKIGWIPADWEYIHLKSLCSKAGEYGANAPAIPYSKEHPRYIRITDITENGCLNEAKMKSIDVAKSESYLLKEGDFLFARTGATVGKTYLHISKGYRCAYAGYLIRFVPNPKKLLGSYLAAFTSTMRYWHWVQITIRAGAQPNINAAEYSLLSIPLPTLPEQKKIAEVLSSCDKEINDLLKTIDQYKKQKRGLMKKLLTGKVRVKLS